MPQRIPNLAFDELMQQLDKMNACHDLDKWLAKDRKDLRSALANLPLDKYNVWLLKQCDSPLAHGWGIPQVWIDRAQMTLALIEEDTRVLRESYVDNNRQPNWDGFNHALDAAKRAHRRNFLDFLISTIVDEDDTQ